MVRSARAYWYLVAVLALLTTAKFGQVLLSGGADTDLRAFTAAAENLRAGAPIYWLPIDQNGVPPNYLYPPLLALLFVLLGPQQTAWWLWSLFSLGTWAGALALVLVTLREPLDARLGARGWPLLLAGLLVFPPVTLHLIWGQVGLPILLCLSVAWWALRRGHDSLAGVMIGVAIALKVYPLLVCLPLLVRWRWRALLTAAVVAAVLVGGSFLAVGWEQTLFYATELLPAAGDHAVGNVGNYALRERLGGPLFALAAATILALVAFVAWRGDLLYARKSSLRRSKGEEEAFQGGQALAETLPGAASAGKLLVRRARSSRGVTTTDDRRLTTASQRARPSSVVGGRSSEQAADFQQAVLDAYLLAVTAVLLISPVVWGHYFVLAILPFLHALAGASRGQLVALFCSAVAMSSVGIVFSVPFDLIPAAQAAPTVGVVILFVVQVAQALRTPAARETRTLTA